MVTPAQLSRSVLCAVRRAVEADELPAVADTPLTGVTLQALPDQGSGCFASNIALLLARPTGRAPREVAEVLSRRLGGTPGVARVEVSGPGFLTVTLDQTALDAWVRAMRTVPTAHRRPTAHRYPAEHRPPRDHAARSDEAAGRDGQWPPEERDQADEPRAALLAEVMARMTRAVEQHPASTVGGPPADQAPAGASPAPVADGRSPASATAAHGLAAPVVSAAPDGTVTVAADPVRTRPPTGRTGAARPAVRPAGVPYQTLLRTLGPDAAHWALLRPAVSERPPLDPAAADLRLGVGHLLVQRETNPLFRVQYAHARAGALLRNGRELGIAPREAPGLARDRRDRATATLVAVLGDAPRVVEVAVRRYAPDRVVRHVEAVADAFLRWHDRCPALPMGDRGPVAVHRSRLALAEATGVTLASLLHLLDISAPVRL